jgi:hypothetical protein
MAKVHESFTGHDLKPLLDRRGSNARDKRPAKAEAAE